MRHWQPLCCVAQLSSTLHVPCRDYGSATLGSCAITGDPPVSNITAGAPLPASNCACTGTGQCAAVSYSNFSTDATGLGSVTLNGTLSALPFSSIPALGQTCFGPGALGTATDTYRVIHHIASLMLTLHDSTDICHTLRTQ